MEMKNIKVISDMGHVIMKPHIHELYKLVIKDIKSDYETINGITIIFK